MKPKPKTVQEYIRSAPKGARDKLEAMRAAIREAAPAAKEGISYRIPFYSYKGRLAWFGLFKEHVGLFVRPPVLEEHKNELRGYSVTKSSLHLPLKGKVPTALVKKLIRAAVKKNEERSG